MARWWRSGEKWPETTCGGWDPPRGAGGVLWDEAVGGEGGRRRGATGGKPHLNYKKRASKKHTGNKQGLGNAAAV